MSGQTTASTTSTRPRQIKRRLHFNLPKFMMGGGMILVMGAGATGTMVLHNIPAELPQAWLTVFILWIALMIGLILATGFNRVLVDEDGGIMMGEGLRFLKWSDYRAAKEGNPPSQTGNNFIMGLLNDQDEASGRAKTPEAKTPEGEPDLGIALKFMARQVAFFGPPSMATAAIGFWIWSAYHPVDGRMAATLSASFLGLAFGIVVGGVRSLMALPTMFRKPGAPTH